MSILRNCRKPTGICHSYQKEWRLVSVKNLSAIFTGIEKYVTHIKSLKQTLEQELILGMVHRVTEFNQEAWVKPFIKLKIGAKNEFEKDFFKLMNNSSSIRAMRNVRKHRNSELVTTYRRSYLVSEPNYHTTKSLSVNLLHVFFIRKPFFCLSLNFLNIMLEIRLRFSKYFS